MKAFISYSHDDAKFLAQLHKHLASLRRQKLLEIWTDREIHAGAIIDNEIAAAMEDADLFLLLVSSSFIDSQYCYEKEFRAALEKQRAGKAAIVPIIVRPCDWHIPELRQFKALPKDGRAVDSSHWKNADEAFEDIAKGLRSFLEKPGNENNSMPVKAAIRGLPNEPEQSFARELLALIMQHPNEEEHGLTEILRESPQGPLFCAFIPNTTAQGNYGSAKKSVFRPAIEELVRLGWLLQPEGNHAVKIYELNPDSRRPTV